MANYIVKSHQNETIEALVWRVTGYGTPIVEQVMELNPNLAGLHILPENTDVILPEISTAPLVNETISLWD